MSLKAFLVHSFWIGFLIGLLGVVGGMVIDRTVLAPECPTEDSCVVNYHDGAWHITEVQP